MLPYLTGQTFGNPSSAHRFGRAARAGLEQARREVAEAVGRGAEPGDLHLGWNRGGQPRHRGRRARRARAGRSHVRGGLARSSTRRFWRPRTPSVASAGAKSSSRWMRQGASISTRSTPHSPVSPAVVSVMWVNNEIGVDAADARRSPSGAARRACPSTPTPCRRSARSPVSLAERPLHAAHALRPQDRRAQGYRRARGARPHGGRGDHPRRRTAARPPARAPRTWPARWRWAARPQLAAAEQAAEAARLRGAARPAGRSTASAHSRPA